MQLWKKMAELLITRKLTLAKDASIVTRNSDGTESTVSVAEFEVLNDLTATAAEINYSADASGRIVTTTSTALNLTVTEHAERVVLINTDTTFNSAFTLPLATGSGVKMTLINNIAQTQGTIIVAANGTTNTLKGMALMVNATITNNAQAFFTSATSDKITFNRTTTGGATGGDIVECWDTATNVWTVQVRAATNGTTATPFAAT